MRIKVKEKSSLIICCMGFYFNVLNLRRNMLGYNIWDIINIEK